MSFVSLRAEIGAAQPVGATETLIAYGSNFSLFFFFFKKKVLAPMYRSRSVPV